MWPHTVLEMVEQCSFGSREWHVPGLVYAVVIAVATEVVAHAKLFPVTVNRLLQTGIDFHTANSI